MSLLDFLRQPSTTDVRGFLRDIPVRKGGILPLTEYGDGSARLDWTAGVPGSIMDAFTAPARAYRGEIAPDQMVPEGLNFAGSVALGSAAAPRPRGSVGMGSLKEGASHLDMSPEARMQAKGPRPEPGALIPKAEAMGAPSPVLAVPEGGAASRSLPYEDFLASIDRRLADGESGPFYGPATPGIDSNALMSAARDAYSLESRRGYHNNGDPWQDAVLPERGLPEPGEGSSVHPPLSDALNAAAAEAGRSLDLIGLYPYGSAYGTLRTPAGNSYKVRVADHGNTSSYHDAPDFNIAPGHMTPDEFVNLLPTIYSNPETSAAPGLGLMAAAKQEPKGFTAYHGSPHDFDRFDMGKIGTGEGAQAYGHGLYFADSEGVARSYRDSLSIDGLGVVARGRLRQFGGDIDKTIEYLRGRFTGGSSAAAVNDRQALKELELAKAEEKTPGKLYQVRINADPDHFLDWDKPLFLQSQQVKDALRTFGVKEVDNPRGMPTVQPSKNGDKWTVRSVWGDPAGTFATKEAADYKAAEILRGWGKGGAELAYQNLGGNAIYSKLDKGEASRKLREAGIPGIKYLDQGSRAAGEGSRNYVVFDDKLIDILKKYGLLGMMGGGAALASGSRDANAKGLLP